MLTKQVNKLPKSIVEVTINIPWADLEGLWQQTLTSYTTNLELPGFRKGQVPQTMVEEKYAQQLQDELLKVAMPQSLMGALQGTDIVPIDYPKYENVTFQKGVSVSFKAILTVKPVVSVGDYKAIKVTRPNLKVVQATDVDKILTDLFNRWKARTPTANQAEPNDEFAKAVGAVSLTELKTKLKADLENEAKYNNELDFEEAILQEVEKLTQVDIPEVLVSDELNRMLVSLQRNVADRGILLDDYLKSQNETVDSLKNKWRPQAEKNVRMELGLSEVAKRENVSIADEELQSEIDKIQDAKLKAQFASEEPKMHLRHALRQTKTLNLLKSLVLAT